MAEETTRNIAQSPAFLSAAQNNVTAINNVGEQIPSVITALSSIANTLTTALSATFPTITLSEATINSSAGSNMIVAAVANQTIRVYKLFYTVSAAANITIQSSVVSLTGPMPYTAAASTFFDYDAHPWFTFASNSAFILNVSAAVQVSGRTYYTQV